MASSGSTFGGKMIVSNEFPFNVKFCGGIYHSLPPLLPKNDIDPKFVQCYVVDSTEDEIKQRIKSDVTKKADGTYTLHSAQHTQNRY
jgi:hypothetical protein